MLCLKENGIVYSFGENKLGQLGQGNQTDAVLSPAKVRLALILGVTWIVMKKWQLVLMHCVTFL